MTHLGEILDQFREGGTIKTEPLASEFKVGDCVEGKSSGRIGYVTGTTGLRAIVRWVRNTHSAEPLAESIYQDGILKHYLRHGDEVRCLPWPEKPSEWAPRAGTVQCIVRIRPLDSRVVSQLKGLPMVRFSDGCYWPLKHVEKV